MAITHPGNTVTIDWTFRRPTGDAPTITGTPQYHIIKGASTIKAAANMTALTGTRYTASYTSTAGTTGQLTVIGTGTFDGLSGEEEMMKIDVVTPTSATIAGTSNLVQLTTGRIDNLDFLDISVASRAATTAANLQALTTARVERLDADISSRLATTNAKVVALTTDRIDNLDNLDTTITSRSTTIDNSSGIFTALTTGRIANLDNLDATISSRSTSTNFSASLVWAANATASNTSGTAGRYLSDLKKRHLNTVTATTAVLTVYQDNSTSSAAWTQSLSSAGSIITQGVQTT